MFALKLQDLPLDQTKFDTFVTVWFASRSSRVVRWCGGAIPLGNYVEATASALGNTIFLRMEEKEGEAHYE